MMITPSLRRPTLALVALLCTGLGCNDTFTRAQLAQPELAITPTTLVAVPSTIAGFAWMVTFTMTITETGGTGADIELITAAVAEAAGGAALDSDHAQVTVVRSTDRLTAGGTATAELTIAYTQLSGLRTALLETRVQVIDDNVVRITRTLRASVE